MTIEQRVEFLMLSAESHDRQIGELTADIQRLTGNIDKLVAVTNQDADNIRTMATVAETHERRITRLEGE